MKKRFLLLLVVCITLCACGSNSDKNETRVRASKNKENNVKPVEISVEEDLTEPEDDDITDKDNNNDKIISTNIDDDFNDYVEVTYTPDDKVKSFDDNADYTGLYYDYSGTDEPYSSCALVKQEDGSYYADVWAYRSLSVEGIAEDKGDGLFEVGDDNGALAELQIDGSEMVITSYYDGEKKYTYDTLHKYYHYENINDYIGEYNYTQENGTQVTVTIYYDIHWEPCVELKKDDGSRAICYILHPPYSDLFIIDGKLIASTNQAFYGPDDDYEPFIKGYSGDTYLIIDNSDGVSKMYYKELKPYVMH